MTLTPRQIAGLAKTLGATRAACRYTGRVPGRDHVATFSVDCTVPLYLKQDWVEAMRAEGIRPVFGRANTCRTVTYSIKATA